MISHSWLCYRLYEIWEQRLIWEVRACLLCDMEHLDNAPDQVLHQSSGLTHEDNRSPSKWKRCTTGSFQKRKRGGEVLHLLGLWFVWAGRTGHGWVERGKREEVLRASTVHLCPASWQPVSKASALRVGYSGRSWSFSEALRSWLHDCSPAVCCPPAAKQQTRPLHQVQLCGSAAAFI